MEYKGYKIVTLENGKLFVKVTRQYSTIECTFDSMGEVASFLDSLE